MTAAATVSKKPNKGMDTLPAGPPAALPISTRPQAASSKPAIWLACQRSLSHQAANNSVKKDCDCSTSDASPEGMPT